MLREEIEVVKIETHPAGQIGIHKIEKVYKNNDLLSTRNLFNLYNPGDSIPADEDDAVKNIATVMWTEAAITRYNTDAARTIQDYKPED
jgi:hypothetical protein